MHKARPGVHSWNSRVQEWHYVRKDGCRLPLSLYG